MKRLPISLIHSVLLLGTLIIGNLEAAHAASHREAPMISLDEKADINNVFVNPKLPPTTPPGNQVSTGIINPTIQPPAPSGNVPVDDLEDEIAEWMNAAPEAMKAQIQPSSAVSDNSSQSVTYFDKSRMELANPFEGTSLGQPQDMIENAPDSLKRDPVEEDNTPVLNKFFSSIQDGQVTVPQGFQAGDAINLVVEGTEGMSRVNGAMILMAANGAEGVQVPGTITDDVGAGIWGNRQVAKFTLPDNLSLGFYDLYLDMGPHSPQPVQIQITDSVSRNRRSELVQVARSILDNKYPYPYAMVGPYSPLPVGAQLKDPNTGEVVITISQDNMWLFFAYDPDAFFGQSDARWILINGNSEEVQIIENRKFWPEVIFANGQSYPFDYGNHDHLYYGLFNVGTYFQDQSTGNGTTTDDKDETDSTTETTDSMGPAIIGLPSTLQDCPPEKIKKYAFLVTLDDTDRRFEELKDQERALLKKLGIPSRNLHEVNPADFVTDENTFEIDEKTWNKSFKKFREKLEAILKTIDDCCAEVLIIVNSHGDSDGKLIFKKSKKGVDWKKVKKGKETIEVKPSDKSIKNSGKTGRGKKGKFASGLLAKMIAETFKKMDKSCIPIAFINHSCYSGKISSSDRNWKAYEAGIKAHENIRVYSSSSGTEETYGRIEDGEYSFPFLEAINHCLTKSKDTGKMTLEDQWNCIVKETKKRAKSLRKRQTPSTYPSK